VEALDLGASLSGGAGGAGAVLLTIFAMYLKARFGNGKGASAEAGSESGPQDAPATKADIAALAADINEQADKSAELFRALEKVKVDVSAIKSNHTGLEKRYEDHIAEKR